MLLINGEACTDKNTIKDHVVNFYTELFNGQTPCTTSDLRLINEVIPSLVSEEDNKVLTSIRTLEDIKAVVFV